VTPLHLPRFHRFTRRLSNDTPLALEEAISKEWERLNLSEKVNGKRIALGLGSRGITGLVVAAKTLVQCIQSAGGLPFVVPAMGSHGGATGPGQLEMLAALGLTPESLGCDFVSSMEVVDLGPSPEGWPLYCDRYAAQADGIFLFNRIKAHTSFTGEVESGIHKMLAIGLGKEKAATWLHAHGPKGLAETMPKVARLLAQRLPFLAGFAVIEDAAHQPNRIEAITPDTMEKREPDLLAYAKTLAPTLPVSKLDVLVIDTIGKNMSGTGMDTHVIGRLRIQGEKEPTSPEIKAIVALRLSEISHGNALGIGLADFTTANLVSQMDFTATARNVFATGNLERGRLPLVFPSDLEAIQAAVTQVFRRNPQGASTARIMRISNTLDLATGWCSESLHAEMAAMPGITWEGAAREWGFNESGEVIS
jgi:hypothetical protein